MAKLMLEFSESGDAAPVPLDRDHCRTGVEKCAGQTAGARSDLVNRAALERPRDRGDPRKKLTVQNEILAERLARAEAVSSDDVAERLRAGAHAVAARFNAHSAAIRIAAAIGRGSALSWPAMSNAVP